MRLSCRTRGKTSKNQGYNSRGCGGARVRARFLKNQVGTLGTWFFSEEKTGFFTSKNRVPGVPTWFLQNFFKFTCFSWWKNGFSPETKKQGSEGSKGGDDLQRNGFSFYRVPFDEPNLLCRLTVIRTIPHGPDRDLWSVLVRIRNKENCAARTMVDSPTLKCQTIIVEDLKEMTVRVKTNCGVFHGDLPLFLGTILTISRLTLFGGELTRTTSRPSESTKVVDKMILVHQSSQPVKG